MPGCALALLAMLGGGGASAARKVLVDDRRIAVRLQPGADPRALRPSIDPANFVATIDNPYLPFKPGTRFHYRGVRGTTPQTDDEVVLIEPSRSSASRARSSATRCPSTGQPVERTFDWYAQDRQGNVWYMGEDSFELKHGRFVKASDSWESGVNGANPGSSCRPTRSPATPTGRSTTRPVRLSTRRASSADASVKVPYGAFKESLVTSEFSPLEPQTEKKYYVAGVGEVAERVVKGHHEEFRLVRITH